MTLFLDVLLILQPLDVIMFLFMYTPTVVYLIVFFIIWSMLFYRSEILLLQLILYVNIHEKD